MGAAEGNGRTEAESSPALGSMARLAAGASRPTGLGRKRLLRAESGTWLKSTAGRSAQPTRASMSSAARSMPGSPAASAAKARARSRKLAFASSISTPARTSGADEPGSPAAARQGFTALRSQSGSSPVLSQWAQAGGRRRAATSSQSATSSGLSTSRQRPFVPLLKKLAAPSLKAP